MSSFLRDLLLLKSNQTNSFRMESFLAIFRTLCSCGNVGGNCFGPGGFVTVLNENCFLILQILSPYYCREQFHYPCRINWRFFTLINCHEVRLWCVVDRCGDPNAIR